MSITTSYSFGMPKTPFTANTYAPDEQLAPDVLGLKGGGYVVAYNNHDIDSGYMMLNFYNASNSPIGSYKFPHASLSVKAQGEPSLAQLSNGNVIVVWDDYDQSQKHAGAKAAIYTADGSVVKAEFSLTSGNVTNISGLDVTALKNGNFVVSYTQGGDIIYKVHNADGVEQVGASLANTSDGIMINAQVTALADGGFVMAWSDANVSDMALKARVFNANGSERAAEFSIDKTGDNNNCSLAALPDGKWAVVYTDTGWLSEPGKSAGITLRVYNADGTSASNFVHVNAPTQANESHPDITVLENGFIAVSWTLPAGPGDSDVHVRVFSPDGKPVVNEFSIGTFDTDSVKSALASLGSGNFLASWQDSGNADGSHGHIEGTVMDLHRFATGDNSADSFIGDDLMDIVSGKGGNDTLQGGGGNDSIQGGEATDQLMGQSGDDYLDGGTGLDLLLGGKGNDTYVVDHAGEAVEDPNGGIDTVHTSINYTLGANIENLVIDGTDNYRGVGNALANYLTGNSGNNRLEGRGGDDTMAGGTGNDVYVASLGEKIIEKANAGIDTVRSEGSIVLSDNVENAVITGSVNADAVGNELDNKLFGNAGKNWLSGHDGNDTLTGGAGEDRFIFSESFEGGSNVDTVTDYKVGEDHLQLSSFDSGLSFGQLTAAAFHIGAAAEDASDRIIYDDTTGSLFFDKDGAGGLNQVKFAELAPGLKLSAADFFIA